MTNSHEDELWYPKLPEGYTGGAQDMNGYGMDGWMPGAGMPNYGMGGMPGMGMPNYGMGGMPGMGMPSYGMGGMTEMGMPSYGMGGMPEMGMPSYGMGGMPGMGMPSYGNEWSQGNSSAFQPMPGFPGGGFPGGGLPGGGLPGGGFPGGGFPGGGFPGGGFPGGGFPGQGGGHQQSPTSPPPGHTPAYPSASLLRVDPGAIRGCLFRYTYVWTSRRNGFWYYPTFVGRTSVAGYRWSPSRRRWEFFGIDLNRIDQFTCF
ncbi:hypothetical protein QTL97_11340 [Sporosarcina thermotolerans]|uniref:Uncharacterized protein n=1 Tax=Sporosarcina thermotolerans TaxID=633404 RepID=A0AAW9A8K9_9BACL|nr:hypothetical protein [Sporosarcina thermotolerans]MDW0117532.1 hypothetical protein [Sporosarcina thermotolerans]WHT49695.1 hypothetical protein QNH10_09500 [Sporosarcina thermotolerans]